MTVKENSQLYLSIYMFDDIFAIHPLIFDLFLLPNNFCSNNFLLSSDINLEDGADATSDSI